MQNINKQIVVTAVVALVLGAAGGYAAGKAFGGPSSIERPGTRGGFDNMAGRNGGANERGQQRFGGNGPIFGEILAVDEKSLTVKLRDSGSRIVFFGSSTPVMRMASGTPADLRVGESVTVLGTTNPDGSVTASSLQIRPNVGFGGGPRMTP